MFFDDKEGSYALVAGADHQFPEQTGHK